MRNKWSDKEAELFLSQYASQYGADLAIRIYSSRLLGSEEDLVLYGGGNTSVKTTFTNLLGEFIDAIYVKASGYDLANIEPSGFVLLDLNFLKKLRELNNIDDQAISNQLSLHKLAPSPAIPTIEAVMHGFIPDKFVDHTHPDAILALTNQVRGEELVQEAFEEMVIITPYATPGLALAKMVVEAYEQSDGKMGMVLLKHGLLTWGDTAKVSYERTIELVSRATEFIAKRSKKTFEFLQIELDEVKRKYTKIAPLLRGKMSLKKDNPDQPYQQFLLSPVIDEQIFSLLHYSQAKNLLLTPPITSDHLIRIKSYPLWLEGINFEDLNQTQEAIEKGIRDYEVLYQDYYQRNKGRLKAEIAMLDPRPRIIYLPGIGMICAGKDAEELELVKKIALHNLITKIKIAGLGEYQSLNEEQLFDMEYYPLQHLKIKGSEKPLLGKVAIVSGAAGAIGFAICQSLLSAGCAVAVTDLAGERLKEAAAELRTLYRNGVLKVVLDVAEPDSVEQAFKQIVMAFGGIDIVVINAGIAYVSSLEEMDLGSFQRLEKVNIEGTLNLLSASAKLFRMQGTGGDIVLISTKNVFSPGAKFGAYSATKAAAHQLARIASLELAELGVRVNMVSPDAVFGEGKRKSGLWKEVGPERMKARGLDESELEEYYRQRNLLKARITPEHVAKAVLFFVTRQTPTTGATIPVDGGLPDSTPR